MGTGDGMLALALAPIVFVIWLNCLATRAIRADKSLRANRKVFQILFVWLIPIFGAALILNLINEYAPECLASSWWGWPSRLVVITHTIGKNPNRQPYGVGDVYRTGTEGDLGAGGSDVGGAGGGE